MNMCVCMCVCIQNMQIDERYGHESEEECGRVYGMVEGIKKEEVFQIN